MVTINYEPVEHLRYIDDNVSPEERAHVEQLIRMELAGQFNANINNIANHNTSNAADEQVPLPQNELVPNHLPLHPMVNQLISPSPPILERPGSMVDMRIDAFEEDLSDVEDEDDDLRTRARRGQNGSAGRGGGVDMSKYTNFNTITSPTEGDESDSNPDVGSINYRNLYTTLGHSTFQQRNLDLLQQNQETLHALQQRHLQDLSQYNDELMTSLNNKRKMIDDIEEANKKRQLNELKPVNDYLNKRWKQGINTAVEITIEEATAAQSRAET
ncbi:uncharacterized protein LODBEIA_P25040 [Lodderomyces beijingensis]|uniref:Uncharacterized protein n=1 Tax=Lodderomyces beijingensis TaxID=1775926 RepID=A0ABP0ZPZ8_9ASCO